MRVTEFTQGTRPVLVIYMSIEEARCTAMGLLEQAYHGGGVESIPCKYEQDSIEKNGCLLRIEVLTPLPEE